MTKPTVTYDPEVDAISVRFAPEDAHYVESEEVAPGVVLDYDTDGRVIGVELLYVRDILATGSAGTVTTKPAAPSRSRHWRSSANASRASFGVNSFRRTWSQRTLQASCSQKSGTSRSTSLRASSSASGLSASCSTHFRPTEASTTSVTSGFGTGQRLQPPGPRFGQQLRT